MALRNVDSLIAAAERLAQVWGENPTFSMGQQTLAQLKAEIDKLQSLKHSREETRVTLSKLIDDTRDQGKLVEGILVRGRSGIKATFGPDSAQYAQVGGTRASQRKSPAPRKQKAPQP